MITGELKNRIDSLWDIFFSGGISNPLKVIQQITYLMFIHDLSQLDENKERTSRRLGRPYTSIFDGHPEYRWNQLISNEGSPEKLRSTIANEIFPLIKNLSPNKKSAFSRYMKSAQFEIESADKLTSIIESLNKLYEEMGSESLSQDKDLKGDIYEYMLGKLAVSGDLGQFRTPRHIIDLMVEIIKPTLKDTICDPACGTAGFLIESAKYVKKHEADAIYKDENLEHFNTTMFTGYDIDRTMLEIAAMNMMQHMIEDPNIRYKNGLTKVEAFSESNAGDASLVTVEDEKDKYSVILANPPFKGKIEENTIHPDLTKYGKKSELLFIAEFIKLLKIGGRAAVIVPNGVLFGSGKAYKLVRKELVENQCLKAVISMPSGVFKPYAGVSTAILVFSKTNNGGTKKVWFYDMKADGYSLDDKRSPVYENDIPDIISRFDNLEAENSRARTEKSFMVPKDEIAEKDYDLSFNKYAEIVYEQEDLPSSKDLMEEIFALKDEFCKELDILKSLLDSSSDK